MSILRPRPGWTALDELVNAILAALFGVETPGRLTLKLLETSPVIKLELDGAAPTDPTTKAEVRYTLTGADGKAVGPEASAPFADGKAELDGEDDQSALAYLRFTSKYGKVKNGPVLPLKFADYVPDVEEPGALTAKFVDDVPDAPAETT